MVFPQGALGTHLELPGTQQNHVCHRLGGESVGILASRVQLVLRTAPQANAG